MSASKNNENIFLNVLHYDKDQIQDYNCVKSLLANFHKNIEDCCVTRFLDFAKYIARKIIK